MAGRRATVPPEEGVRAELVIGPHLWRVVSSPEVDIYLSEQGLIGETKSDQLIIRVRSDLPASVWRETVLHEVLHACWSLTSLPETLGDREEEVVRALSPLLAQVVDLGL